VARLSLTSDPQSVPGYGDDDSEGKSKFRTNLSLRRLSLKNLSRSKSDKVADKRVMNWINSFSQFAPFAPRFTFTTWEQLLGYTSEDLSKLGLPMHAVVPLSKIISVIAEESAMERALENQREATAMPYALLQVPDTRNRSFSYNNRAIATSEHVKTLEELFQDLDKENRGFINESELSVALKRYGVIDQEGAKAWFSDIDNNQRGVIDRQQFVDFMTYVYPLIFQQAPNPVWSPRGGSLQQMEPPTIFLGGSCNPTSWRRDIAIPLLQKASVSYFNPQVEEWHEGLIAIEARAKASATLLFFVIDSLTLSLATMIECTELMTSGRPLVLVINDLPADAKLASGEPMPKQVLRDANRARAYMADVALRHRIQPYSSISRAVCELIQFLHGGWTGGGYETRPRATLAKKSEESWTNLKQKVQTAILKMNAGRRGSLRGIGPLLPEPSVFSLPPPRSPDRGNPPPPQQRTVPAEPGPAAPPDPPFFSNSFSPLSVPPNSPIAVPPNSPPTSSKMVPVNVLGNFPQLAGGSPPMRPSNHRSGSIVAIPIPSLTIGSPLRVASTSSEPRSLLADEDPKSRARACTKTSSISSLGDIAESVLLERTASGDGHGLMLGLGTKTDSPRSFGSNPDLFNDSPVTTPIGSTPSSFLSFSPANSPTGIGPLV
jgi:hypothetical protein